MATLFSFTGEVIEPRVDGAGNPCPVPKRDLEADNDCAEFEHGKPNADNWTGCTGDGHYMCTECKNRVEIPLQYEAQI